MSKRFKAQKQHGREFVRVRIDTSNQVGSGFHITSITEEADGTALATDLGSCIAAAINGAGYSKLCVVEELLEYLADTNGDDEIADPIVAALKTVRENRALMSAGSQEAT